MQSQFVLTRKQDKHLIMRRLVDLKILSRLDRLIRRAATGTPKEFAERLGISCSSLYELLAYMKNEMDAPIIFDNTRPSYMYAYPPKFYLGFERDRLETNEQQNTFEGLDESGEIDDDDCILDNDIDFSDLYQ